MRTSQLLALLDQLGLSPEKAAAELGVSGMTLRRWRSKPPTEELPEMYRRAAEPLIKRMVGEGRLHPEDPAVVAALTPPQDPFQKSLLGLGITPAILETADKEHTSVVVGLARIGEDKNRQEQVRKSGKMFSRFAAMSADWKNRLDELLFAVKTDEITAMDKLVAFGALFYLITPFDLVPDAIPLFGLVDDFIILGIAAVYYRTRFPDLFGKKKKTKV